MPQENKINLSIIIPVFNEEQYLNRLFIDLKQYFNLEDVEVIIVNDGSDDDSLKILQKLNNSIHYLISSVCISKNGSMIWNHTDSSELKMKNLNITQLNSYLSKIKTETLLAYGVYQIEAGGLELFKSIKGDKDSIMGLPIKQIINYIKQYKNE